MPPANASPELLAQLRRARPARPAPVEVAALAPFFDEAIDRQRIQLRLRGADGSELFCHAGELLEGKLPELTEAAGLPLPRTLLETFSGVAASFLEASEIRIDAHRTRLALLPGHSDRDPRANGLVLEWKDGLAGRPALEEILIEDFRHGRWDGLNRSAQPRHPEAAARMMDDAARLAELLERIAAPLAEVSLAIRSFDTARSSAPVGGPSLFVSL
ncbi:MAG TPA: hypothetical protein VJ806_05340 [Luteimonas sp.]|nr:hypothetical protein [Luteimonas sp.]